MKKILIIITLIFSLFAFSNSAFSEWEQSDLDKELEGSVTEMLWKYTPGKVVTSSDYRAESWFKDLVQKLVTNISYILWVLAIWAIVYWGITLVISAWEDEKVSKWKNIIKWAIIGFIWLVSASGLITITINIIYWLAGV